MAPRYVLAPDQSPTLRDMKLLKRTYVNEADQVEALEELFQRWLIPTPTDTALDDMTLPEAMHYVKAIAGVINADIERVAATT